MNIHPLPECVVGPVHYLCFFSKHSILGTNVEVAGLKAAISSHKNAQNNSWFCRFLSPSSLAEAVTSDDDCWEQGMQETINSASGICWAIACVVTLAFPVTPVHKDYYFHFQIRERGSEREVCLGPPGSLVGDRVWSQKCFLSPNSSLLTNLPHYILKVLESSNMYEY